jgi:putative transposase
MPKRKKDETSTRVLRLRLKDKHADFLRTLAAEVNFVWNYCNEIAVKVLQREQRFIGAYELDALTAGATKAGLSLHSQTVQAVSAEYVTRRKQFKKRQLRWRVSNRKRANYSLGWVPFKASAIKYRGGQVYLAGVPLSLWDSYGLSDYQLGAGNISEDARGRWYLNVTVKVKKQPLPAPQKVDAVGIDLGLKSLMAASTGETIEAQRFYRDLEPRLGVAQRSGNKRRARALHAKIANRRKDFLHKLSTALVRQHGAIFVGNVNASGLAKTSAAKSVLDAGWSAFRTMLQYKCDDAGRWFKEVNEAYSTQDCHVCSSRTGPKGRDGLQVRRWTCSVCLTEHDRDVNAAVNIRKRGLLWLEKEFAAAGEARADEAAANEGRPSGLTEAGHGLPAGGIPVL